MRKRSVYSSLLILNLKLTYWWRTLFACLFLLNLGDVSQYNGGEINYWLIKIAPEKAALLAARQTTASPVETASSARENTLLDGNASIQQGIIVKLTPTASVSKLIVALGPYYGFSTTFKALLI